MALLDEAKNTLYVTAAYLVALSGVTWLVSPLQRLVFPEVTVFAALVFLPHGVRVLAAWLFGWRSVVYLLIATATGHALLTPDLPVDGSRLLAWILTSACAPVVFTLLRLAGRDYRQMQAEPDRASWRELMLVAFLSSALNSVGHNLLFAPEIWPVGSVRVFAAFLIGDTLGTFAAFAALMVLLRSLRSVAA